MWIKKKVIERDEEGEKVTSRESKSEDIYGDDVGRDNMSESYRKMERCPEDVRQACVLEKLRCSGFLGGPVVTALRFHSRGTGLIPGGGI